MKTFKRFSSISAKITSHVSTLTLVKPTLSIEFISQLNAALSKINSSDARALVLHSSHHKIFCAGADLKEREKMSVDQVEEFVTLLRDTFSRFAALRIPTVAAIDGYALGGGIELALACDLRLVGENAKIGFPETKLAIIPGFGL